MVATITFGTERGPSNDAFQLIAVTCRVSIKFLLSTASCTFIPFHYDQWLCVGDGRQAPPAPS